MSNFLHWLGSSKIKSTTSQVIAKTLTIDTYVTEDDKVFVVAEDAFVSYDNGFYEQFKRNSDVYQKIQQLK